MHVLPETKDAKSMWPMLPYMLETLHLWCKLLNSRDIMIHKFFQNISIVHVLFYKTSQGYKVNKNMWVYLIPYGVNMSINNN